jgi:hypothetical protein
MMYTETEEHKSNVALQLRTQILEAANKATDEERDMVANIVDLARKGDFTSKVFDLTPAMGALLFINHNGHNRNWSAETAKEYARRMTAGLWKRNNATIGLYPDGNIEDGAHRLSGAALAGCTLRTILAFGIPHDAISTVDNGKARHGSDHAKLSGINNAVAKQQIIRGAATYLKKLGHKDAALRSASEVHAAIMANDEGLEEAIRLATIASTGIADAVLRDKEAQIVTYLMLLYGWPAERIRSHLADLQKGISREGEKNPLFVVAVMVKDSRQRQTIKDKLTSQKEVAAAIFAMVVEEAGGKAITGPGQIKAAIKKQWPDPAYPAQATTEAVA